MPETDSYTKIVRAWTPVLGHLDKLTSNLFIAETWHSEVRRTLKLPSSPLRSASAGLLVGLFGAILFAAAACTAKPTSEREWARRVAKEAGLQLPAGARVVAFHEPDYFVDPVWAAKVEFPRAASETLIQQLAAKASDATHVENRLARSLSWWRPKETHLVKQYLADRQTLVYVVVARESAKTVAYIECMVF